MRGLTYAILALAAVGVVACSGTGVNSATNVFPPQKGTITLKVATSDATIQSVQYTLNGKPIGNGDNAGDGWALNFDTTKYPDGTPILDGLYTVVASGTTSSGSEQLLNNSIFINNGITSAPASTPAPLGTVTPGASGTSGTSDQTASGPMSATDTMNPSQMASSTAALRAAGW